MAVNDEAMGALTGALGGSDDEEQPSGGTLTRQMQRDQQAPYERELARSLPPLTSSDPDYQQFVRDQGGVLPQGRIVRMPSGEVRALDDTEPSDTFTALEVGGKRIAENYFRRKDEEMQTRDDLYDMIYERLPPAEQERLSKPRHMGWQYDSYKNMPPLDFVGAIEKGGQVSRDEIKSMLGEDVYESLLAGDIGGGGIYRHLVAPFFTKDGVKPSEQLEASVERARAKYTEDTRESVDKPFIAEDAELLKPTTWFDETTKAPWEDWDGFYYSFIEQVPNFAAAIGGARKGGRLGAKISERLNRRLNNKVDEMLRARQAGATAGGMVGGTATEGLLIRDAVYSETTKEIAQLPEEKWQTNEQYLTLIEAGYDPETAKQVVSSEIANKAGNTAMVVSGAMGAPMSGFFGRMAAGRIGKQAALPAVATGVVGEGVQEGAQESVEQIVTNLNVRRIDPDKDLFASVGEAFAGGFLTGGPAGALGALPSEPNIEQRDQDVIRATQKFTEAANERWKFQNSISREDPAYEASPKQRVEDLQKLERLQRKEAEALLKAAPRMRDYMERNGAPEAELKMLSRLEARSNMLLTDISTAKSKRTTVAQMLEEERQIQKEREEIQNRIAKDQFTLEGVRSMADAIEATQNLEAVSEEDKEQLIKAGYARNTEEGRFVIKPKGRRALKELRRQQTNLEKKMAAGYTGEERRNPRRSALRERIEQASPEELRHLLYTDHLTGLRNKRAFEDRKVEAGSYAAIDADSLKWVNDNMGHPAGDRMLQTIGRALEKHPNVSAYHLSGDEFAVTGDTDADVEAALQAVAKELAESPITEGTDQVTPTITWGKGKTYKEADDAAKAMKEQRLREGKRADARLGQKPPSHKDLEQRQGMLFHYDDQRTSRDHDRVQAKESLEKKKPIAINSQEWASLSLKELQNRAIEKYRQLMRAASPMTQDQRLVKLSMTGYKKVRNHSRYEENRRSLEIIPQLRELINTAVYLETFPPKGKHDTKDGSVRAFHMYGNKVELSDGKEYYVKMLIRETNEGSFHYDHNLTSVESVESSPDVEFRDWWTSVKKIEPSPDLPTRWRDIRDIVQPGDEVEILTPNGAVQGTVTSSRLRRGKDRLHVWADGHEFVFNPNKNWLIRPENEDDLTWLNGGVEYQPSEPSPPHVIPDFVIGHLGNDGYVYADLAAETTIPGYFDTSKSPVSMGDAWYDYMGWQPNLPFIMKPYKPPEATAEEMARAETVRLQLTSDFRNLPPVRLVGSLEELKLKYPKAYNTMVTQAGSKTLGGIRGFWDDVNPENGIIIMVHNIRTYSGAFEKNMAETILHELIGHYGVRGVFGNEADLRQYMHDVVDAFPELARRKAVMLGLYNAVPRTDKDGKPIPIDSAQKQTLGEEMIAYVAGEMLSKNGLESLNPKQRGLIQRILDWIRDWLVRKGWGKYLGIKKQYKTGEETLWEDADTQRLLQRSLDFVRNGRGFEFQYLTGQHVRFMRDADIFRSGLQIAINEGTRTLSKGERKSMAQKYGGMENVPKVIPLFPEEGSPNAYITAVNQAKAQGLISAKELELSKVEQFLERLTYADLIIIAADGAMLNTGPEQRRDFREKIAGYMPGNLAREYLQLREREQFYYNKKVAAGAPKSMTAKFEKERGPKLYDIRERISEIEQMKLDPKKSKIDKDILLSYLNSDQVVRVRVQQVRPSEPDYFETAERLGIDPNKELTEEEQDAIRREIAITQQQGWNIGWDAETQRWLEWPERVRDDGHRGWTPEGVNTEEGYMVFTLVQEGGGKRGSDTHHGVEGAFAHMRIGIGEFVPESSLTPDVPAARNPTMVGKLLMLAELQSDWLQTLRKGFPTQEAHDDAQRAVQSARSQLDAMSKDLVSRIEAELLHDYMPAIEKLANIENEPEMADEFQQYVRDNGLQDQSVEGQLTEFRNHKLAPLIEKYNKAFVSLDNWLTVNKPVSNEAPQHDKLIYSMDMRAFEQMDRWSAYNFGRYLVADIRTIRDNLQSLHDTSSTDRFANMVEDIRGMSRRFAVKRIVSSEERSGFLRRLPAARYLLESMFAASYDPLQLPAPDLDKVFESRVDRIVGIPLDPLRQDTRLASMFGSPIGTGLNSIEHSLREWLNPNTFQRLGLSSDQFGVSFSRTEQSLDMHVTGPEEVVDLVMPAISRLLHSFFTDYAAQTFERQRDHAKRMAARRDDPTRGMTFQAIVDAFDMEEIDTDERSGQLDDHGVYSYEEWEEREFSEYADREYDSYVENVDWDEVTDENGDALNRDNPTYRDMISIDDDGDVDNSDAESWLERVRDEHLDQWREDLYQDPTWVHQQMREDWEERGGSVLMVGELPTEFDEDGDPIESVNIVFRRSDLDSPYELLVDGDPVWQSTDGDERDEAVGELIEWYQDRDLVIPPSLVPPSLASPPEGQLALELQDGPVDFTDVAETVMNGLVVEQKTAPPATKLYEQQILLQKRLNNGGIVPDSPLSPDKYWRTTALKFLISEAVRQGLPGIGWNPGLASTARGGMPMDARLAKSISWSIEPMTIRGQEQEVAVVTLDETGEKIVVDLKKHGIPVLGRDVMQYINEQRAGKKPRYPKDKAETAAGPSKEDYLISRAGNYWVVQTRDDHSLIGTYRTEAERDKAIDEHVAKRRGERPSIAGATPEVLVGDAGKVTEKDIGGPIALLMGTPTGGSYRDTFAVPRLAGARQSYEDITIDIWNDFLKQYNVEIGQHVVKVRNIARARQEQGARIVPGSARAKKIREAWGEYGVEEMKGANHGWIVWSEKEGVLVDQIFATERQAQQWLDNKIPMVFGSEDGGALIYYIPITDKMAEDFSRPVPPFHYDPSNDPVLSKAMERIGQESKPNFRQRYREWKQSWRDHWYQGQFDRFYGLKRAVRMSGEPVSAETDPYIQARLSTSLDSVMKAVMEYGHPVWKDGIVQVEGKGLLEILQPVIKDIDTWCLYMAGKRAKRLMTGGDDRKWAEIMDPQTSAGRRDEIINEGREKNFTPEMIDRMVKLGEEFPVLERVAAEYAEFNKKVLDFAEEAGIINKETRATWEHADYVPFYRVVDERIIGGFAGSAGIANQNSPIRRLKGSDARVGDIAHNIMINLTKLVDSSMKNHAALMGVDLLLESGIIQKEPYKFSSELVPMNQVKKLLIDQGMDPNSIPEDALEGFQKMFALQPPTGEGVISVLRNGKKEFYRTDDPLLYRAMTAINKKAWGAWMNLLRAPKRLLTSWITIDPGFMIANYMRDSLSAFVLGRDDFIPVVHAAKGFAKALAKDKDMVLLLSSGAAFESGYINQGDPNTTRRYLKKKMRSPGFARTVLDTPAKLYDAWRAVGSATENANRMAVYQAALRAGKSKAQAVYEAKDLMDFSMGGDWPFIQFLIQTVPFLGARQQGLHRLGRGAHDHPLSFTLKGILVGLAGLALWFAYRDDERYKELEEWDKDTYFHWWIGDNHYRLPKPFEVGAIFNTIPERIAEYIYSNENDAGKHLFKRFGFMLAETFNANPVPQLAKPMLESYFNYNWFTGRDIVSPYEEQRMPPEQYRYTTSPTMVEISRMLPGEMDTASKKIRSPLHLQNLWYGYTGTIGRYMLMGADALVRQTMDWAQPPSKTIADYPVVGRFLRGEQPRRTKYEQEVYDLIRKVTAVQGSVNFLAKTDQVERMDEIIAREEPYILIAGPLEDIREHVNTINQAIMHIWMDKEMTPEQKRQEIDILQEDKNALFEEGYKLRPGGQSSPTRPVGQADIDDLLNKFGVDDSVAKELHDSNPNTYELLQNIAEMNRKQLETLAKLGR